VTLNLRDFPTDVLNPFGVEAQYPDEFVFHLLDLSPRAVVKAAPTHRQSLKNPPMSIVKYLGMITRQGLIQSVELLREYML
jgi:hypothetical protein